MPEADTTRLYRAGLVHGLGKLGVSNHIWEKTGMLTTAETERMRMYPYLTGRILSRVEGLESVVSLATKHEERIDGSGFPQRPGRCGADRAGPIARRGGGLSAATGNAFWRAPLSTPAMPRANCAGKRAPDTMTASLWRPCWRLPVIGLRGGHHFRRASPPGRSRFCVWSRRAGRIVRLPTSCSLRRKRHATTSSASTPSSGSITAHRRR